MPVQTQQYEGLPVSLWRVLMAHQTDGLNFVIIALIFASCGNSGTITFVVSNLKRKHI
ncbi:hypothetical protein Cpin_2129 [Chitinophaga pinensis DSM 2588]|uniref:Uncharacterized protein n=1 Tax=Chitinophaga pinensis (strain ATCC 43595 / DSM 2588 / LMG 13176 / NBRC 15968 / NCIMB 11800 / UQM 2034) TaxID=485918 RepID=A0A979G2B7_CHIPD|nr:hypothetical protein Cpin_2129 [Chitinophaga pinensis DSM 2588]